MKELKWELITELQTQVEGNLLSSYSEADSMDMELYQETVENHFPGTFNGEGAIICFKRVN